MIWYDRHTETCMRHTETCMRHTRTAKKKVCKKKGASLRVPFFFLLIAVFWDIKKNVIPVGRNHSSRPGQPPDCTSSRSLPGQAPFNQWGLRRRTGRVPGVDSWTQRASLVPDKIPSPDFFAHTETSVGSLRHPSLRS
jgi:hypothetical protein